MSIYRIVLNQREKSVQRLQVLVFQAQVKWWLSIEVFDERQDIGDFEIFIQFIEPLKRLLNLLCVVPQVMQEGAALGEYIHDKHFELIFL